MLYCLSVVEQKASTPKRRGPVAKNTTPSVLLSDDEQEKEVYEEKGKRRSRGRSSQARGRSSRQVSGCGYCMQSS